MIDELAAEMVMVIDFVVTKSKLSCNVSLKMRGEIFVTKIEISRFKILRNFLIVLYQKFMYKKLKFRLSIIQSCKKNFQLIYRTYFILLRVLTAPFKFSIVFRFYFLSCDFSFQFIHLIAILYNTKSILAPFL